MVQAVMGWLAQYNMALLCLALAVCAAGSYVVIVLMCRALSMPRARRLPWLSLVLPTFAADVWTTHFIAMLGFSPGPQLFYELDRTVLSLVVAMAGASLPLALVLLRPGRRSTVILAGAGLGLTIGAMHFTGMSALRFCGTAGFDPRFGITAFALGAGMAALMVRLLTSLTGGRRALYSTLALMGAICGLHFTALLGNAITIGGAAMPVDITGLIAGGSATLALTVAAFSLLLILGAFLGMLVDQKITLISQKQADTLNYIANYDDQTQLPNRRFLRERIAELLNTPGQRFMLHFIELDRYRPPNDMFGHSSGDDLVRLAAERMREHVGPGHFLARLGGDQFIVLQPLAARGGPETALAAALVQAMAKPFMIQEGPMCTGISLGLVFVDTAAGSATARSMVTEADVALASARNQGGGQFCLFQPEMNTRLMARRVIERDLGGALARSEMFLHFQPLCGSDGTPRGFEALLRWRHGERGFISPAEFIPYAEHSGHIHAIGLFVLERACRAAMAWPAHLRVAVNISAVQLRDPALLDLIKAILACTGLPPRRLELEITESVLIEDTARVGAMLREMHEFGLELAIDDFGTGYSNLSHLRDFCASRLKIDRSFISGLRADSDAGRIVAAITGLGHALGMEVLAEGVETAAELDVVRTIGCDEVQGYYLARPMPEADIAAWLATTRRTVCPVLALTA